MSTIYYISKEGGFGSGNRVHIIEGQDIQISQGEFHTLQLHGNTLPQAKRIRYYKDLFQAGRAAIKKEYDRLLTPEGRLPRTAKR